MLLDISRFGATLVEVCAGLGAAIGVLTAVSHEMKHPTGARACSSAALKAGNCLGQQLSHDLIPYVRGGIIGLLIGGVASLVLVLLTAHVRASCRSGNSALRSQPRTHPAPRLLARLHRQAGVGDEPSPSGVRHEVWRRDEACCVDCGSRERLEFDHVIPISKGGSNTARNIELRCEICNGRKGARI
jgi:hypothetical protein